MPSSMVVRWAPEVVFWAMGTMSRSQVRVLPFAPSSKVGYSFQYSHQVR